MPNVFLIGRPGCGKSAVYKLLEEELRAAGYGGKLMRIDDFPILKQIFDEDIEHRRHRPIPEGGVKVTDDAVWDDLTKALNQRALKLQDPNLLLFIEFSRDSYVRAFKNFSPEILRNSLILYIDAPFDVCWERNARRALEERGLDAHLVSWEEMEKTYARDDSKELPRYVDAPILVVKNDSDDIQKLRRELQKVVKKLKRIFVCV
ncbi:MAG: AAA family ATPase [Candidatus Hodarchaeaceae archaeon]|nr:AAA family ATPase [Candidatus Hodarchaeaceae archaeon]